MICNSILNVLNNKIPSFMVFDFFFFNLETLTLARKKEEKCQYQSQLSSEDEGPIKKTKSNFGMSQKLTTSSEFFNQPRNVQKPQKFKDYEMTDETSFSSKTSTAVSRVVSASLKSDNFLKESMPNKKKKQIKSSNDSCDKIQIVEAVAKTPLSGQGMPDFSIKSNNLKNKDNCSTTPQTATLFKKVDKSEIAVLNKKCDKILLEQELIRHGIKSLVESVQKAFSSILGEIITLKANMERNEEVPLFVSETIELPIASGRDLYKLDQKLNERDFFAEMVGLINIYFYHRIRANFYF